MQSSKFTAKLRDQENAFSGQVQASWTLFIGSFLPSRDSRMCVLYLCIADCMHLLIIVIILGWLERWIVIYLYKCKSVMLAKNKCPRWEYYVVFHCIHKFYHWHAMSRCGKCYVCRAISMQWVLVKIHSFQTRHYLWFIYLRSFQTSLQFWF